MNVFVNSILSKNLNKNYNLKELKGLSPVQKAGGLLKDEFVQFLGTMYNSETKIDDSLYDLIEYIDQDCFDFLLNFFLMKQILSMIYPKRCFMMEDLFNIL